MPSVYEIITGRVIDQLEKGVIPWQRPWVGGAARNLVSGKEYRGLNVFLLAGTGYSSPYWLTLKQANELGGAVKPGEKSNMVIFWKANSRKETPDTEEEEKTYRFVLRYYRVFNVCQCDGISEPDLPERQFSPVQECEKIAADMPHRPVIRHGEPRAYYSPSKDLVNMPERCRFIGAEEYYSTLFHELTHATGHSSRLNRHSSVADHSFGSKDYSKEELVAEMGAAFLCGHAGIENKTIDNSSAYISGWLSKLQSDKRFVIYAAAQAQKAADFILGH